MSEELLRAEIHRLKAENARLDALVYMPGDYQCPKCGFVNHRRTLHAATGDVRACIIEEDLDCPNDGTKMVRVTWKEGSDSNHAFATQLLNEMDWLDRHCSFVADAEYNLGPFKVGELRRLAQAGLAADQKQNPPS